MTNMLFRSALLLLAVSLFSHPVLASVDADGPVDGAAVDVQIDVSYDSQPLDSVGVFADVPLSLADAALLADGGSASPVDAQRIGIDGALAADASLGVDVVAAVDGGGARSLDAGVDSGVKPIPLVDGGAQGLVKDDRGCSIGASDGRRSGGLGFGLVPFVAWVALRVARRRGRA